jgi:CRP/FNR family transcriptional regulator
MVKNRAQLKVSCSECSVAHLCIATTLTPEEKEKLNSIITKIFIMDPGEHLYYQDQKMQHVFALYSGCCKEYTVDEEGEEKVNNFYFPGDLLALESLPEKAYTFSAVALEKSRFCAIPYKTFFPLMQESQALFQRFIDILSYKMQTHRQIPLTTNAKRRIAAFLLDILSRLERRENIEDQIHLPMSQFDISNLLGLAHETVSRTLHIFQEAEMIKIKNKVIYVTDIDALKAMANSGGMNKIKDTSQNI